MGWNGSGGGSTPVKPRVTAKKPSPIRGLVAGLVVVAAAVAVFLFLFSGDKGTVEIKVSNPAKIKESKPAKVQKAEAPKKVKKVKKRIPYWERETTNGLTETQALIWHYHRHPPSVTNNSSQTAPKPRYEIFNHSSENAIAAILTAEPGEGMVGEPPYGESFERDFMKSCETPIVVTDEDDEYQSQLKKDMTQVKIELRQRMADGEKLGDILRDARHEIQRLAQIKRDIEAEIRKQIKENARSSADIDLYFEAANKLLDSRGIAPIKVNPLTRHIMERAVNRRANAAIPVNQGEQ